MKWSALLLVLSVSWACEDKKDSKDSVPTWEDNSQARPIGPIYEDQDFVFSAQAPLFCSTDGPMAPGADQRRLSVPVEIRALTEREVQVGPLLFFLEDKQGHRYRATLAGCGPKVAVGGIKKGQTAKGEIAFDVPADLGGAELGYEPFLIGRKKIAARITLSQPYLEPKKSKEPLPEEAAPSE